MLAWVHTLLKLFTYSPIFSSYHAYDLVPTNDSIRIFFCIREQGVCCCFHCFKGGANGFVSEEDLFVKITYPLNDFSQSFKGPHIEQRLGAMWMLIIFSV